MGHPDRRGDGAEFRVHPVGGPQAGLEEWRSLIEKQRQAFPHRQPAELPLPLLAGWPSTLEQHLLLAADRVGQLPQRRHRSSPPALVQSLSESISAGHRGGRHVTQDGAGDVRHANLLEAGFE